MAWKRSDILSFCALGVSILSLIVSAAISFVTFRYQYGEDLALDMLPLPHYFVHAYSVERSPDSPPRVRQVAAWYRMRLNNRSNKSVSVVDANFREDSGPDENLPSPFVSAVNYAAQSASLGEVIRLPFTLGAGEAKEFYVFLPTTVSEQLGRMLVTLMRGQDDKIDTELETILFLPNYFDDVRRRMLAELRSTKMGQIITFNDVNVKKLTINRAVLSLDQAGKASFRDAKNDAADGFRFKDGLQLYNEVTDQILSSKGLNIATINPPYSRYTLVLRTSTGGHYEIVLHPGKLPLDRLAP